MENTYQIKIMDVNYLKDVLSALANTINDFFSSTWGLVLKAALALAIYFGGIEFYIWTVAALTCIDVITGVWSSLKQGHKFESRKLRKGLIEKAVLYLILLISAFILGKLLQSVIPYETFYLTWSLSVIISVYELTSIIENVVKIYPELSFLIKFKKLLKNVEKKQLEAVEEKLSVIKEEEKKEETTKEETQSESINPEAA